MNRIQLTCLTLLCVLLSSSAQIALKRGVASAPVQALLKGDGAGPMFILHAAFAPLVILGLALYVISTGLWLVVLAKSDALKMSGIALITAGVFCVARS
jgi:hypothetical protein